MNRRIFRTLIGMAWASSAVAGSATDTTFQTALERLAEETGGAAEVAVHRTTGVAHMVRFPAGSLPPATAKTQGREALVRFGALFGVTDPSRQLVEGGQLVDRIGHVHYRWTQLFENVPVFGGELRAHYDRTGHLLSLNGLFIPDISTDPVPNLSQVDAERTATVLVAKHHGLAHTAGLRVPRAELQIYRAGLAWGHEGGDHLVWNVEVTDRPGTIREFVLVDAHDGQAVERIAGVHTLNRVVDMRTDGNTVWSEGDPLPYAGSGEQADAEINQLITTAEHAFQFFSNLSGGTFLSWDAADGTMRSVYNTEDFECDTSPNASWNGSRTAFCPGMTDDDTVAHEWTHAYTDSTHNLVYLGQSGALNEAYSDIFAETLDQVNEVGTDSPDLPRLPGECSVHAEPTLPTFSVITPATIRGSVPVSDAEFNPPPPWSISGQLELVNDGTEPSTDACEPLVGFAPGNIAVIDRGDCNFIDKVKRAEEAGAVAAVVINNDGDEWVRMGRPDGDTTVIGIPSVFMRQSDGDTVKAELSSGVQVSLFIPEAIDTSVRWAMSEDSIFQGLRDLWNPNCLGDPDRVSDPLYWCSFDDSGGVHTNSGVPNHGYALLVDGGTFNGRTVQGIGLTRAANIYWRAMTTYQVPLSDFFMHADALDASCQDLLGLPLPSLTTGAPSGQTIREADCGQVAQAAAAVELRMTPNCDPFIKVLEPDAPVLAGNRTVFFDDFNRGPKPGWSLSNQGVYDEYVARDWQWTTALPEGRSGGAMHAANTPTLGDCVAGSDDQSGVVSLQSPEIVIPPGDGPVLAFDHWVGTERAFDGGNLKISVNGGAFELVESDAFLFNEYNRSLQSSVSGNTNPMAGEPAFSGSDFGTARGSWGQSQVDLSDLVAPGDAVRIRFDFGTDGCVGAFGWYLDSVQVRTSGTMSRRPSGRRVAP